ncbi:FAD-dependent thymidylate synthase [Candidatus Pacearchaeota archaeon]|nr:FAD-dependent thymidylate synthase [Candidatus Pacearchaeota archaeon]
MGDNFRKKVELVACLENAKENWDPEDTASCGARGCFDEKSSRDIHKDEIARPFGEYEVRKEKIFAETSGKGHGAVLDQSEFLFSIDNLTRASTLFLCAPQYASHLQQSLRRATAQRGFHLPKILEETSAEEIMNQQFGLYEKMQSSGIPAEDARFILPLYTKTAIQTKIDARELMHLHSMAMQKGVPEEVKDTVEQMVKQASEVAPRLMKNRGANYEVLAWMPSSQLFAEYNRTIENLINQNFIGGIPPERVTLLYHAGIDMTDNSVYRAVMERDEAELANMKHYHFSFLALMSIASFHQATRQRTWDQSIQTIRDALKRGYCVIPPSIQGTKFEEAYKELNERTLKIANSFNNNPEYLGIIPHSLKVYDLIHINGWNAVHSIGKRTCTEAQWEIRSVARDMASHIKRVSPEIGKYSVPQGKIYGKCPEKKPCGLCYKS